MGKFSGFMAGCCFMASMAEKWGIAELIRKDRETFSVEGDYPMNSISNSRGVQVLIGKAGKCLEKTLWAKDMGKNDEDAIKIIRYGVLLLSSLKHPIDTKKAFEELGMKDIFEKYKKEE